MPIMAQITFEPQQFHVQKFVTGLGVTSYMIVDGTHNHPVGWCFDPNMANVTCLALELVHAQVRGDKSRASELSRQIDKLAHT